MDLLTLVKSVYKKEKKNLSSGGFYHSSRSQCEKERKESKKVEKYVNFARELRSCWNEGDSDTSCSWHAWNSSQGLEKKTGGIGNQTKNQDHSIVKIG